MKLFTEPLDLDLIEGALRDEDFLHVAFAATGRLENWRSALEQTSRLLTAFEDAKRNDDTIYGLISLLIQRAAQFPETDARLAEITSGLGLVPGTNYLREIQSLQFRRSDPEAWQTAKNQMWLEQYRQCPVTNGDR